MSPNTSACGCVEEERQHLCSTEINTVQAGSARAEKISTGANVTPTRFHALYAHEKYKDLCHQGEEFLKNGKYIYSFICNSILPIHRDFFQHICRQVIAVLPHSAISVLVLNLSLAAQTNPVGKQSKSWVSAACVSSLNSIAESTVQTQA